MTKPADAPRLAGWLTATEVADIFGVSRQTVNLMITGGEFLTLHIIGPATRPQYVVRSDEVRRIKATRTFQQR